MTTPAKADPNPAKNDGATRVLGIEGGGTKTEWLLADCGSSGEIAVVRSGRLPSANLKLSADEELTALFSVLPPDPRRVGVFLAGCATEEDHARLRRLAATAWPSAALTVGSDRESALATAFGNGDGVIAIAGTGAAVYGRRGDAIERAGGWGQLLGDQGGGYHIAMQGLRSVLTHFDMNDEVSSLAQKILQTLGLNRLRDLVDWVSDADKMSIARVAPAIFEAASRGDSEMRTIVRQGAEILAELTHAVLQRLDFPNAPVRLFGGLFAHHPEYAALFCDRLAGLEPDVTIAVCDESGALGAAWLSCCSGASLLRNAPVPTSAAFQARTPDLGELSSAATEEPNPRSVGMDRLEIGELVDLFVSEEGRVNEALGTCRARLCEAIETTAEALRKGGRLFYVGAGTSGRLGVLDASEIPPTFGVSAELVQGIMAGGYRALFSAAEGAEDQAEAGALAVSQRGVRTGDIVCGLTASGRTPFVLGALERGRQLHARTLLITCNPARRHAATPWDVEIDLPTGPELLTGSTRLKAGSATKLALNVLSTCAMIRLGKVRGNAMIDVRVSNEKLRDRGVRLISGALGVSYEEAARLLEESKWNVRACLEARSEG